MNWMNYHKLNSESDDEYLHRSKKLQAQIENNVKNSHHIQLMIFFKGMNSVMKWKIYEHLIFLNLQEDLVTLTKKLHLSVDDEITIWVADFSFTENINTSFFKWKKQKSIVSSFIKITEYDTLQEKFESNCNYCRKYDHREWDCLKKKSDIFSEKLQFISHITDSNWVNLTFSYESMQSVAKIKRTKSTSVINRRRL